MLKKLLYNKYKILNIPENLPYTSEQIFKVLYDKKRCIMFRYGDQLRLLGYIGFEPDFLGRATKYQPMYIAGSENYDTQSKEEVVVYNENALSSMGFGWSGGSYVIDDIDKYIDMLEAIDKSIIVNSKQVLIPFIAKTTSTNQATLLKNFLIEIFGEDFDNMVVECKLTDNNNGTLIETTNVQLFIQTLQDTKRKILDEVFLYLGVGAPAGKLAHESELEVQQNERVVDLLDTVMFDKFSTFIAECNQKFGCNMQIIKKF